MAQKNLIEMLEEIDKFKATSPSQNEEEDMLSKLFKGKYLYSTTTSAMDSIGGLKGEGIMEIKEALYKDKDDRHSHDYLSFSGPYYYAVTSLKTDTIIAAEYQPTKIVDKWLHNREEEIIDVFFHDFIIETDEKYTEIKNKVIKKTWDLVGTTDDYNEYN